MYNDIQWLLLEVAKQYYCKMNKGKESRLIQPFLLEPRFKITKQQLTEKLF